MNKTEPVVILAEKENKNNSGLINSGFYKLHTNIFKNYKKNIY